MAGSTNSYSELLRRPEWKAKSKEIKDRDGWTCQSCGISLKDHPLLGESFFDVHHKYYRRNWLPWAYPNSALITLCCKCHKIRHEMQNELNEMIQSLSLRQFYLLFDRLRIEHDRIQPMNFWRCNQEGNELSIKQIVEMACKRADYGITFENGEAI